MKRLALVGFPDGIARQDIAPTPYFKIDYEMNQFEFGIVDTSRSILPSSKIVLQPFLVGTPDA